MTPLKRSPVKDVLSFPRLLFPGFPITESAPSAGTPFAGWKPDAGFPGWAGAPTPQTYSVAETPGSRWPAWRPHFPSQKLAMQWEQGAEPSGDAAAFSTMRGDSAALGCHTSTHLEWARPL